MERNKTKKDDRWGYTALLLFVEACRAANSSRSWNASQSQLPDISPIYFPSKFKSRSCATSVRERGTWHSAIPKTSCHCSLFHTETSLCEQLTNIHKRCKRSGLIHILVAQVKHQRIVCWPLAAALWQLQWTCGKKSQHCTWTTKVLCSSYNFVVPTEYR